MSCCVFTAMNLDKPQSFKTETKFQETAEISNQLNLMVRFLVIQKNHRYLPGDFHISHAGKHLDKRL